MNSATRAYIDWRRAALLLLLSALSGPETLFASALRVRPDDFTVLSAVDAERSPGLAPFQPGGEGRFYLQGWRDAGQWCRWTIDVATADTYEAWAVVRRGGPSSAHIAVEGAGQAATNDLAAPDSRWWERVKLEPALKLPVGPSSLALRMRAIDGVAGLDLQVGAVELVRPPIRESLRLRALAMRADPAWMQQARYGVMVHWTKESMPRHGDPLPYDQAVAAFDVEAFADSMRRTGAGFVVFTTAHALHYFPAPLSALDRVLPGRTGRRDLVADLADALGRRGMKLLLYYHLGAAGDPAWLDASGYRDADATRFFALWRDLVTEVGTRYGEKLAGWWFDEGATVYYARNAPWESLAQAAKAGNPRRLVTFNAWELANPTEFHDFCSGEGCQEPRGFGGVLREGGDGRYPSGTHAGLQATACLIAEADWGHFQRDAALAPPKWNAGQLAALLQQFSACRNVPIFNLEITQEGQVSPLTLDLFEQVLRQDPHVVKTGTPKD